jgi:hypothetical protein
MRPLCPAHLLLLHWVTLKIYFLLLLFFSCSSRLEHRASLNHFVSLQFLNLRVSVGALGQAISPLQGRNLKQTE